MKLYCCNIFYMSEMGRIKCTEKTKKRKMENVKWFDSN